MLIPKAIQDQIDWLHQEIGNTEWSGILVYTIESGTIAQPKSLIMEVKGIFLLDIGSPGYTEFGIGHHIMDLMEELPNCETQPEKWKMGKIHTHHNMGAYHSGTDMGDLHDNAPNFAFYLSLVVDFFDGTDTKIGIHTKEDDRTLHHSDGAGGTCSSIIKGEEMIMVVNVDTIGEPRQLEIPDGLQKMYDTLLAKEKERKEKAAAIKYTAYKPKGKGIHLPKGQGKQLSISEALDMQEALIETSGLFTKPEISKFCSVWISMDHISDSLPVGKILTDLEEATQAELEAHCELMKDNFERMASEHFETGIENEVGAMLIEATASFISNAAFDVFESIHAVREVIDEIEIEYTTQLSEF